MSRELARRLGLCTIIRGGAERAMDDDDTVHPSALVALRDEDDGGLTEEIDDDNEVGRDKQRAASSVGVGGCANACKQAFDRSRNLPFSSGARLRYHRRVFGIFPPSYPTYSCIPDISSNEAKHVDTGIDAAALLSSDFFSADCPFLE